MDDEEVVTSLADITSTLLDLPDDLKPQADELIATLADAAANVGNSGLEPVKQALGAVRDFQLTLGDQSYRHDVRGPAGMLDEYLRRLGQLNRDLRT